MISVLAGLIGLAAVILLWKRQRPAFIAAFLIVYTATYRIIDITYLDLFGPVYATELERHVGGNMAAPMFVLASLCFLLPLGWIASQRRIVAGIEDSIPPSAYLDGLHRAALVLCGGIIAFLYLDMIRIGTIPLLAGMDRLDYNPVAGYLHNSAYELNFLISAALGIFTVLPRLRGGRFALSFPILIMLLLMYWALTGNRFSAFLVSGSFYALPFGAVVAMQKKGILRAVAGDNPWGALVSLRVVAPLAVVAAAVTVTGLLINSYYSVRNYADPVYQMTQRVLVQPVQTWATAWQRASADKWDIDRTAIDYVLFRPSEVGGNPAMRYIMEQEIGYFRADALLSAGQQYAGGYPEIFFELFGFWLPLPLMILLGCTAAYLFYLALRSLCRGMPLTALMAVYLSFGFSVAYLGGMLSFLLALTYWIKVAALIVFYVVERGIMSHEANQSRALQRPGGIPTAANIGYR